MIHGFDVDWMKSIIGLRLSIPEWWWRDENGNPYSKSNKLWKGEIIDVHIPDYKYNRTYVDGDSQYFMFKCDDGDDNKYPMRYSEVWKFADDDQFDKLVLPIKMPEKSVDKDYHSHCVYATETEWNVGWEIISHRVVLQVYIRNIVWIESYRNGV